MSEQEQWLRGIEEHNKSVDHVDELIELITKTDDNFLLSMIYIATNELIKRRIFEKKVGA